MSNRGYNRGRAGFGNNGGRGQRNNYGGRGQYSNYDVRADYNVKKTNKRNATSPGDDFRAQVRVAYGSWLEGRSHG